MISPLLTLVLTLLTSLLLPTTTAFNAHDTIHISLQSSHVIHIAGGFGFAPTGKATLSLDSFSIQQKEDVETFKAFFILRKYSTPDAFLEEYSEALDTNRCLVEDGHDHHNDILIDVSDQEKWGEKKEIDYEFDAESSGLYYLMFQRCEPAADDKHHKVSFLLHHHFANYDSSGKEDHLSVGEQPLPTLYFIFGLLYLVAAVSWVLGVRRAKASEFGSGEPGERVQETTCINSKPSLVAGSAGRGVAARAVRDVKVHHIHHLMTVLIAVKAVTVFADAIKWHYIRSTGSGEAWTVIYYLLAGFKGIALFLVLMLIGSGWR